MKKLISITLLGLSVFASNLSHASAEQEYRKLVKYIQQPINNNYNLNNSVTKVLSKVIVSEQERSQIQFNESEAITALQQHLRANPNILPALKDANTSIKAIRKFDQGTAEGFARAFVKSWVLRAANCGEFAYITLNSFYFDMMYRYKQDQIPDFKQAKLVQTVNNTGDHIFVLVEGNSGTMFAIDPWISSVKQLSTKFTKLSKGITNLNDNDNRELNSLFSIPYYDVIYVNNQTKWQINDISSKLICDHTTKYDDYMEALYQTVQYSFEWGNIEYTDLIKNNKFKCN